jgi:HSP20 family protein
MTEAPTKTHDVKIEKKPGAVPAPWTAGMQVWQSLRDEMEQMFDRITRTFAPMATPRSLLDVEPFRHFQTSFGMAIPAIDVIEKSNEFQFKAELPGLDQSNVELSLSGDALTIKGEKSESKDDREGDYHLSERRYGAFQRSLYLPPGVDRDKITAKFEKGVLVIRLPKTAEAVKQQKKIAISK